jgi:hypothetical protein
VKPRSTVDFVESSNKLVSAWEAAFATISSLMVRGIRDEFLGIPYQPERYEDSTQSDHHNSKCVIQ